MPLIIAHRGARTEAPENTKSAFDASLKYSIDGFEFDVQMSKDGKTVLYHDKTLNKINHPRKKISDYSYKELCKMDWGSWFSPEYKNEPLLTLAETLSSYCHRTKLMIEIKTDSSDQKSGRHLEITDAVLQEIKQPNIIQHLDNIYILSFDSDVLKHAYRKMQQIKYVLNLSEDESPTSFKHIFKQPDSAINYLYALCVNKKYLSEELVKSCQKLKKQIMTYSCNTLTIFNKAVMAGADFIMTDKPKQIKNL